MRVAVPKEIKAGEKRVALVPDIINKLTRLGLHVNIESGAGSHSQATDADKKNQIEIEKVLQSQVKEWNNGSVEGFMEGYLNSETIRFASGGKVTYR